MTDYSKIKSIVKVLKTYGIDYPSKIKNAGFEKDLGFDRVFVGGLIYDVEEALQVFLNQEEVDQIHNARDLINYMLDKTSLS